MSKETQNPTVETLEYLVKRFHEMIDRTKNYNFEGESGRVNFISGVMTCVTETKRVLEYQQKKANHKKANSGL
jgi:uncharacterized protein YaaN involved in tellurite resistance